MTRQILYSIQPTSQFEERLNDFLNASTEKQRFLVQANKLPSAVRVIKYETDEKLAYFTETVTPKFGVKGYLKRSASDGVTFIKAKKKLQVWYGKKITNFSDSLITSIMVDIDAIWYVHMVLQHKLLITRLSLEKIFKGKITNQEEFITHYVKYHLKLKGLDPVLYMNTLTKLGVMSSSEFNMFLKISKDPQYVLENFNTLTAQGILERDDIHLSLVTGEKIDYSLSPIRINEQKGKLAEKIGKLQREYNLVEEVYRYIPD